MSDTTANTGERQAAPAGKVSMTKPATKPATRPARPGRPPRPPVVNIKPPRWIDVACLSLGVMLVASVVRALLLLGSTPTLLALVEQTNAKAKKPDPHFDAVKAVHAFRQSSLLTAAIIGIALLLLAWSLRRGRSASPTRWALLVVFFFTGMPFYVIPTSGLPAGAKIAGVVIGLAAIATVLLVFVPPSSVQYFKACREANTPEELRGQQRPGLGSLFGPRKPRGTVPTRGARPAPRAEARPATPKAKAKVRADSDSVARGAELARARAKASKSRRTGE